MNRLLVSSLSALFATGAFAQTAPVGNNFTTPQKPAAITYDLQSNTPINTLETAYIGGGTGSGPTVPFTTGGMRCKSFTVTNDDAASGHNVIWQISDASGNVVKKLGAQVPASAGLYGVLEQPVWGPGFTQNETLDDNTNQIIDLYPGWSIQVALNDAQPIQGALVTLSAGVTSGATTFSVVSINTLRVNQTPFAGNPISGGHIASISGTTVTWSGTLPTIASGTQLTFQNDGNNNVAFFGNCYTW